MPLRKLWTLMQQLHVEFAKNYLFKSLKALLVAAAVFIM